MLRDETMELAGRHAAFHRMEVTQSEICGCFYCGETFPPNEIEVWENDDATAVCPRCTAKAVIGSKSGFPIDADFLRSMHDYWF
jgi:hypothetical protein